MGENSKIEWCDHSWNPWLGCTKVGPPCDHCYAESMMDHRYGRVKWGAGEDRVRTSEANWKLPFKWDRAAAAIHETHSVFCLSLGDIWDNEVDPLWRRQAFRVMEQTPNLLYLLLSKRIGNARKMCDPEAGNCCLPSNAALGATMANQEEWDRDFPKLQEAGRVLGARFTFASVEPMLGSIDARGETPNWVIVGGESGPQARPMSIQWVRELRDQCATTGAAFFFKQFGEWAPAGSHRAGDPGRFAFGDYEHDRKVMIQVDGYPREFTKFGARSTMQRVGKKSAGRLLDGIEWNQFPEVVW